jgi:hypothetical protein
METHDHKTVSVFNPINNGFVNIDEGIVDLITALWDKNFETVSCCEAINRNENVMIISFMGICTLKRLLKKLQYTIASSTNPEIIQYSYSDYFISRMCGLLQPRCVRPAWKFVFSFTNYDIISVEFPKEDYQTFLTLVKEMKK